MANEGREPEAMGGAQGRVPVPDPTLLTTQALRREIEGLRELLEQRLMCVQEETNLQFTIVERQRVEQKKDTRDAVDSALTAQKEAVSKAEAGMMAQIQQLATSTKAMEETLRRSIDELKERYVNTERQLRDDIGLVDRKANATVSEKAGAKEDRTGLYATIAVIASILLVVVSVIAVVAASSPAAT